MKFPIGNVRPEPALVSFELGMRNHLFCKIRVRERVVAFGEVSVPAYWVVRLGIGKSV